MKTIELLGKQYELPDRVRFYYQDAEEILGLKRTAVRSRKDAANIRPYQDENSGEVYFDRRQMQELINCHNFTLTGGKLANYHGQFHESDTEGSAEGDATAASLELSSDLTGALVNKNSPWYEPLRNIRDEIMMNPIVMKHLRLEAYFQLQQPISDKDCIAILDFAPPRTGFREFCYQFEFWGWTHYPGKKTKKLPDGSEIEVDCLQKEKLWKIRKIDLEAEAKAKLEAKEERAAKMKMLDEEKLVAGDSYETIKALMNDT